MSRLTVPWKQEEKETLVLRPVASLLIGAVLALLLAFASQFILLPFMGTRGVTTLSPLTTGVFWLVFVTVLLYVVVTVIRGRR